MSRYLGLNVVALLLCMQTVAQANDNIISDAKKDSLANVFRIPFCLDCNEFLIDPSAHPDVKFKSVTELHYVAKDSSLKNKELTVKHIHTFNALGEQTMKQTFYLTSGAKDSMVFQYNDKKNVVREIVYSSDSAKKPMHIETDHIYVYDAMDNKIKDSSVIKSFEGFIEPGEQTAKSFNKEYTYSKYDTAHNEIWELKVDNGDTTIQ
ncbi:MAG TPA: hypothetical protein VK783_03600, partial [Bacteroidia bacterium]|nr:hypothetical protein [Bacteroidia bacterium]